MDLATHLLWLPWLREWRRVPVAPPLTRILRSHLDEFGTGPDGHVFSGIQRGELASQSPTAAHGTRRAGPRLTHPNTHRGLPGAYMTCAMHASLLGSTAVVPPAQVAEWAGHSVAVLLKVYAKCIDGQDQIAKRRIEDALAESDDAAAPATDDAEDSGDDDAD